MGNNRTNAIGLKGYKSILNLQEAEEEVARASAVARAHYPQWGIMLKGKMQLTIDGKARALFFSLYTF
jgi:hypothetical protein